MHQDPIDGSGMAHTYAFTYDKLSRLTNTQRYEDGSLSGSFVEQGLVYNLNGNITALKRYGENSSLLHDFTYGYSGNQLTSFGNTGNDKPGTHAYGYDANGNMTSDGLNSLELKYNFLNLISKVSKGSTPKATYTWRADGVKLGVRNADGTDGFEYVGSLVYRRTPSGLELESAAFGGGRIIASQGTTTTYSPNYFLTDHLGGTRVVVDGSGNL